MDANYEEEIFTVLSNNISDGLFDIIIDDASHIPSQQIKVIKHALKFLNTGGILIVEDISRDISTQVYEQIYEQIKHLVSFHTFIICDHKYRYSPGANNDKLLVFIRK